MNEHGVHPREGCEIDEMYLAEHSPLTTAFHEYAEALADVDAGRFAGWATPAKLAAAYKVQVRIIGVVAKLF